MIGAAAGRFDRLIADKSYDTTAIRAAVAALEAEVVIPSTLSRRANPTTATPIAHVTSSNALGAGSKIGGASPHATTRLPSATSPVPLTLQLSSSGTI